jgi:hypothetical protein
MTDVSTYMRQARARRGVDPRQKDGWTWDESRAWIDALSDHVGEWQGIPIPLGADNPLVLAEGHPLRDFYAKELGQADLTDVDIIVAGGEVPEDEEIVNTWFSRRRNAQVYVARGGGRYYAFVVPVSPDRSMDRLTFWLQTIGSADAWDLEAEYRARDTLRAMLTERQWMHYDLTGCFFETSPRSRVTYVFRRLRPTLALSPRGRDGRVGNMLCLAVLCLHPIGYYANSWAGCMVPSDDVIAHLSWMRGDEAAFWKHANQHDPASPEAGI